MISAVVSVSTVVCPACLRGGVPLALMSSASEVPIGLSTSEAADIPGVSWLLVDLVPHHHVKRLASLGRRFVSGRGLPVFLSFRQHGPDDTSRFVGHRGGRQSERLLGNDIGGPDIDPFRMLLGHHSL